MLSLCSTKPWALKRLVEHKESICGGWQLIVNLQENVSFNE